ncbi:MAG: hypothetical protein FJY11_09660 [Bacteroidetes bacterium]|nr:hypothetical protein [Bacteroidota bacterium]
MSYINTYRQRRSFLKRGAENLIFEIRKIINYHRNGRIHRTILFYPEYPRRRGVLYKVFRSMGFNITNDPSNPHNIRIFWSTATIKEQDQVVRDWAETGGAINMNCTDVSKSRVDAIFTAIFGYSSLVDPLTYGGEMVKKSEINAAHDGVIVKGPVEPENGFVYQKLIDNSVEGGMVADLRIPVIMNTIPHVYVKYKRMKYRFGHFSRTDTRKRGVDIMKPDQVLSDDEISRIKLYVREFGLDYCELDVLRDKATGLIYIVDVNNAPFGLRFMDRQSTEAALSRISDAINKEILMA